MSSIRCVDKFLSRRDHADKAGAHRSRRLYHLNPAFVNSLLESPSAILTNLSNVLSHCHNPRCHSHPTQLESHSTSIKTQLSNIDPGIAALVDTAVALEDSLDGAGDEDGAENPVSGCLALECRARPSHAIETELGLERICCGSILDAA
jgi:hypothetical protein